MQNTIEKTLWYSAPLLQYKKCKKTGGMYKPGTWFTHYYKKNHEDENINFWFRAGFYSFPTLHLQHQFKFYKTDAEGEGQENSMVEGFRV